MFLFKKDDKDLNVFYNYYWYIQYLTAFVSCYYGDSNLA